MCLPLYFSINGVLYRRLVARADCLRAAWSETDLSASQPSCCSLFFHMGIRTHIYLLSLTFFSVQTDTFPSNLLLTYKWWQRWKHCFTVLPPCSEVCKEASLNLSILSNTRSKPTLHDHDAFCLWIISVTAVSHLVLLVIHPQRPTTPSPFQRGRRLFPFLFLPGVALLLCLRHNHL